MGSPSIDLFVSRANFKVKRFISFYPDPMALRVDAIAIPRGEMKTFMHLQHFVS